MRIPRTSPALAGFTARMLTEGTRDRSATEIADAADHLGVTLKSQADVDNANTTIDALSNTTDATFDLLSDVIEHPAFAQEEVDRVRKAAVDRDPAGGGRADCRNAACGREGVYGDSPYGYPAVGTTASVKSITRDDFSGFWNAHYGPQTAALVLTGDITEKEAREQADKYFGVWKDASAAAVTSVADADHAGAQDYHRRQAGLAADGAARLRSGRAALDAGLSEHPDHERCARRALLLAHQHESARAAWLHLRSVFGFRVQSLWRASLCRGAGAHGCDGAGGEGTLLRTRSHHHRPADCGRAEAGAGLADALGARAV